MYEQIDGVDNASDVEIIEQTAKNNIVTILDYMDTLKNPSKFVDRLTDEDKSLILQMIRDSGCDVPKKLMEQFGVE